MLTNTPSFKVISNKEGDDIPVSVAGSIMMDIQSLIVHIGAQIIEKDMMTVYTVPKEYLNRFILHITEVDGRSMTLSTEAADRFTGTLMDDTVKVMTLMMNMSESNSLSDMIETTFPDPKYKSWVIGDLSSLSRDVVGYSIQYAATDVSGIFKGASKEVISEWSCPLPQDHLGMAVGLLYKDPLGRTCFACDEGDVNLNFNDEEMRTTALGLCDCGPCAVKGHMTFARNGNLIGIDEIISVEKIPSITFSRIISKDRDVKLSNPVTADISHMPGSKIWTFTNSKLDVSVSGNGWDDTIRIFHEKFMERLDEYEAGKSIAGCKYIKVLAPQLHR
ncbi:MAG: hypothetical protein KRP56_01960 [Candidatus Methanogranum gryphiswaldense]|nr:MAG: hypothetical protein KRP56_01960 [Candidatus Methanogranum sp. U3.2.1]